MAPATKKNLKYYIFLGFLVLLTYLPFLKNDFVSDDIAAIKENPGLGSLTQIFSGKPPFISLTNLTYGLIYRLFGATPEPYRFLNILSHLGSVIIIFNLVRLFFPYPINLFAAGIFALHPILTESVVWISGSHYSFSAFFILLAFYNYLLGRRNEDRSAYRKSIFSFVIGLLFSERVFIFPLILCLYEFALGDLKKQFHKIIPFAIFGLIWAFSLFSLIERRESQLANIYYQNQGFNNPLIQLPIAIFGYSEMIFWPKDLTFYHSEMIFSKNQFAIRIIFLLIFAWGILHYFRKNRLIFFWTAFFIVCLSPTLTPFRISWVIAERYVYLGSLGIIVFIACLIDGLGRKLKNISASYIIFGLLLAALFGRTLFRLKDWKNQDTLWLATARTSPSSHQNHNNLGDMYLRHEKYDQAIEEFQIAIRLLPNYADAYHNLGNAYHFAGRDDLAETSYRKAISQNPNLWQTHQNLASLYFSQKKFPQAIKELEEAIKILPQKADFFTDIGTIYLKTENNSMAKAYFEKALLLNPQDQKAKIGLLQLH